MVIYECEEHTFEKLIRVSPSERRQILHQTDGFNAIIHSLSYIANSHTTNNVVCRPSEEAVIEKHRNFLIEAGRLRFTADTAEQYIATKRDLFLSMVEDPIFWCALLSPVTRNICVAQSILKESNVQHRVNVARLKQVKEAYEEAVALRVNFVREEQMKAAKAKDDEQSQAIAVIQNEMIETENKTNSPESNSQQGELRDVLLAVN